MRQALGPKIPAAAKVFGWLLVAAGSFFAYIYMVNPGAFFPGVSIATYSEQFGLYSTGVRILGAVVGILVALVLDSAGLFAVMLVTRIFIELGDVVVGLVLNSGHPDANTATLVALAAIEAGFLASLVRVLARSGGRAAR